MSIINTNMYNESEMQNTGNWKFGVTFYMI